MTERDFRCLIYSLLKNADDCSEGGREQKMLSPFVFFREIFLLLNFPFYLNPFLSFPRYIICNTKEARQNRAEIRKRAVMGSE